jgi:hypothetical protein
MKIVKFIVAGVLMLLSATATAQTTEQLAVMQADADYWRVARRAEQATGRCDSLAVLMSEARARYAATSEETREGVSARIVVLEQEMYAAKRQRDEAVAAVVEFERRWISTNKNKTVMAPNDNESLRVAAQHCESANFIRNGLFVTSLSAADYKMLCDAQTRESVVANKIADYRKIYDKMVSLRAEYDKATIEQDAVPMLAQIEQLRERSAALEDDIVGGWQTVADNKTYLYNLLLEQEMQSGLLTETEQIYSASQAEADGCVGVYESDGLSSYYYQKLGLLKMEMRMASELGMPLALDSLKRASSALRKEYFCIPQVSLEKRVFIDYEPLKVILPTIYSSRNPIPQTKVYERGTIYRIRIGIFTNRPNLSALRGITPLSYTTKYHDGKNAYFVGGFATEKEAREGVAYLKKLGFRDPIVVMWVDGEYVSDLSKPRDAEMTFNIEISGLTSLSDAVKSVLSRNSECQVSRIGGVFVAGAFVGRSSAESVAAEISRLEPSAQVTVKDIKR